MSTETPSVEALRYIVTPDGYYEITVVLNIHTVKLKTSKKTALCVPLAKYYIIMPLEVYTLISVVFGAALVTALKLMQKFQASIHFLTCYCCHRQTHRHRRRYVQF
jgi:hypothetical protein